MGKSQTFCLHTRPEETRIQAVKLSVVVPVYNEKDTIEEVVRRVIAVRF